MRRSPSRTRVWPDGDHAGGLRAWAGTATGSPHNRSPHRKGESTMADVLKHGGTQEIDDFYRSSNGDRWRLVRTRRPGIALCGTSPTCPPVGASLRPLWRNGWTALVPARKTRLCGRCWKDQTPQAGRSERESVQHGTWTAASIRAAMCHRQSRTHQDADGREGLALPL
jgi:hypothetical protein